MFNTNRLLPLKPWRALLGSLVLVSLVGCSSFGLSIANLPAKLFKGKIHHDLVFDEQTELTLDVYQPRQARTEQPLPVIVFYYGGRWSYGSKDEYTFVATALAAKGFVVVVPDYRKYPKVRFPDFVTDSAKALRWVYNTIDQYHGNKQQLFIAGHSAGAHIGALLITDQSYLREQKLSTDIVTGFAGLAGPYAFTPTDPDLVDMFGPESTYPRMQVPTFVDGQQPPMLLMAGDDDTTVKMINIERLVAAIDEQGGQVQIKTYPGVDHIEMVGAFSKFWRGKAPVLEDTTDFFNSLL